MDRKVIIFSSFSEMCKILNRELAKANPLMIIGETPDTERQKIVAQFNTDPNSRLLIMSEAGAYGLNLQAASCVIHYDLPFSLAKIIQREGRAHRMGQKETVLVYRLIGKKTVDEYIAKKLLKKQDLSDKVLVGEVLDNLTSL